MGVVDVHEGANEAIARLNAAVEERTRSADDPTDGMRSRPKRVPSLPAADYGTVEGCDRALRAVDDRIERLSDIADGAAVERARDEALAACRDLRRTVGEHRGRLATDAD